MALSNAGDLFSTVGQWWWPFESTHRIRRVPKPKPEKPRVVVENNKLVQRYDPFSDIY